MTKDQIPEFLEYASSLNPALRVQLMNPGDAVFEENVKMNCYYCGKYGNNWRCPPNIPDLDYPKMFREFDHGAFVCFAHRVGETEPDVAIAMYGEKIAHGATLGAAAEKILMAYYEMDAAKEVTSFENQAN